jgi:hypothetical protein
MEQVKNQEMNAPLSLAGRMNILPMPLFVLALRLFP